MFTGDFSPKLFPWFNWSLATSGQSLAFDSSQPRLTKWINNLLDPGSNGILVRTATNTVTAQNYTTDAVLTGDGTNAPTAAGVIIDDNNAMYGYYASANPQTGTTYTFSSVDAGKKISFSNASAITVTCANSLSAGFSVVCIQGAAGQITFTAAAGATLNQRQSALKTAGQWAVVSLIIDTNSTGTAAVWVLGGDTST